MFKVGSGPFMLAHAPRLVTNLLHCGRRFRAQMYVPAAVRKCSIAHLQEVADLYPAFGSACFFAVALLGVRTRRCLISDLIYDDHLGSQTLGAPYSVPYN